MRLVLSILHCLLWPSTNDILPSWDFNLIRIMFLSYTHQSIDLYGKSIEWFLYHSFRSSHPEVFYEKDVLKICSKFTWEHPCRSAISIKLLSNFIKIALWHGFCPANLLHIFRNLFLGTTLAGCFCSFKWVKSYKYFLYLFLTKV